MQVVGYGYSDSFLVAKTKDYEIRLSYYIIDRTRDLNLAHDENYRIGPRSNEEYIKKWRERIHVKFEKVQ
jgi:histidinol phosphatase-like enzyme